MIRGHAIRIATLVAGVVVSGTAWAGYTTGSVNLRTGPGTGYPVITTAPPGAFVHVRNCGGRWCVVTYRGATGWMSANYIADYGPGYPPARDAYPPPPVYYYPTPYYYPYAYPRYYRPRSSFGLWFGFGG